MSEKAAMNAENAAANETDGQVFVLDDRTRNWVKIALLVILIVLFPPAAIFLHANECNKHVCLSLVLLAFFVLPSILHAVWYCFLRPAPQRVLA